MTGRGRTDGFLRLTVADALLAAALVAMPALALVRGANRRSTPSEAHVFQGGRLVSVLPLNRDREFVVESGRIRLVVEVKAGAVSVRESNCPKGICRHTGRIDRPGRPIVCIPGRVVIEVRGRSPGYDAESY
jgi:hypothetical protein